MLIADDPQSALGALTTKQREVLDLVLCHKSSKEIARILTISPYTVDQRITGARKKLGAGNRGEVARLYGRLKDVCGQSAYDFSQVEFGSLDVEGSDRVSEAGPVFTLSDAGSFKMPVPWDLSPTTLWSLEALDHRFGILWRVFAIGGLAVIIAVMFLVVISIAQTLNGLV